MKRYSIKVNGKVFDVEVEERNAAATAASVSAESADEAKDTDSRDAADAGERAADTQGRKPLQKAVRRTGNLRFTEAEHRKLRRRKNSLPGSRKEYPLRRILSVRRCRELS